MDFFVAHSQNIGNDRKDADIVGIAVMVKVPQTLLHFKPCQAGQDCCKFMAVRPNLY